MDRGQHAHSGTAPGVPFTLSTLKNVRAWTEGVEVERDAVEQIRNIATLPVLGGPVAVMPDVHLGKGTTVGTVIPTRAAIIPAAVGDRGLGAGGRGVAR